MYPPITQSSTGNGVIFRDPIQIIQTIVARSAGFTVTELLSKKRPQGLASARMLSMYFCHKYKLGTLKIIATWHGKKDHGTVIHACDTMAHDIFKDPITKSRYALCVPQIEEALDEANALVVEDQQMYMDTILSPVVVAPVEIVGEPRVQALASA